MNGRGLQGKSRAEQTLKAITEARSTNTCGNRYAPAKGGPVPIYLLGTGETVNDLTARRCDPTWAIGDMLLKTIIFKCVVAGHL